MTSSNANTIFLSPKLSNRVISLDDFDGKLPVRGDFKGFGNVTDELHNILMNCRNDFDKMPKGADLSELRGHDDELDLDDPVIRFITPASVKNDLQK